ncbi:MAG: DUF6288 domain-containing protein [Verrucomicrobiales bacterium]
MIFPRSIPFAVLALTAALASPASAAGDPPVPGSILDFTAGDKLPARSSHDWTLGPTGMRGWCQVSADGAEGTTRKSRQILITKVDSKGPAGSLFRKGDVIVGVQGRKFDSDARISFARAIAAAEAADGRLSLTRFRNGAEEDVVVELQRIPAFSPTAPYDCERSAFILREGCQALAKQGLGEPSIPSHINALALLASGDSKYLGDIKAYARKTVSKPLNPGMSLPCWSFAFTNIFLSEYYLATGDRSVLKEIARLSHHLANGQGPMGTWGHAFVDPESKRLRGYGAVNAVGLPVAISLVLARECGVKVDRLDESIQRATEFFRRHVGLGAIPYGDGPPNLEFGHDDNGKNSAAAIFFDLLGDSHAARYYTQTALAAFGRDREQGHTGNFFNMLWSLPAVSLAGPDATGAWLSEFGWYHDLARDPDYKFPYQGYPRQGGNSAHSSWKCPGAYLLHFALPQRKLRITGREKSCVPPFSKTEIMEAMGAGYFYLGARDPSTLQFAASSWSPVVRTIAIKELKRTGNPSGSPDTLKSGNPLERMTGLHFVSDFDACIPLLEDPDLRVRITAMRALTSKNKPRALHEIFKHLDKNPHESPVFTQYLANYYFPLGASEAKIGSLLTGIPDRQLTLRICARLLDDEDSVVSSRIAMGLISFPEKDLIPLLPTIHRRAYEFPLGNVMFNNRLRLACAQVMVKLRLNEGITAAADLLVDNGWGRNARMPMAARLLKQNAGQAKSQLNKLRDGLKNYKKSDKWATLIEDTMEAIKNAPRPNERFRDLRTLTR